MFGKIFSKIFGEEGESLDVSIEYLNTVLSKEDKILIIKKIMLMMLFGFNRLESENIEPIILTRGYHKEKVKYTENDPINACCCTILMYYFMSLPNLYSDEKYKKFTTYTDKIFNFIESLPKEEDKEKVLIKSISVHNNYVNNVL